MKNLKQIIQKKDKARYQRKTEKILWIKQEQI